MHNIKLCIIHSMVGRSIAAILDRSAIFSEARSTEGNMPPRSDIVAMDQPTILYVIYRMVSVQQTNLSERRETAEHFQKMPFFTQRFIPLTMVYGI